MHPYFIDPAVRAKIQGLLAELEQERGFRILYACESGSRAWGFPSPDSDYDIRIVFVYPREKYLSITQPADQINLPITDDALDIAGWELRKFLHLAAKSNVTPFEWLNSNIVYHEQDGFKEKAREVIKPYFSTLPAANHYLGLTQKTLMQSLQEPKVKIKKYFYALRPVLAALWVATSQSIPPLQFERLWPDLITDSAVREALEKLLERKEQAVEGELISRIPVLDTFIETSRGQVQEALQQVEKTRSELDKLNDFFRLWL
ncbi:MAG: nucleotidyltransferase domain-containing protein [Bacteroidota bacterium]